MCSPLYPSIYISNLILISKKFQIDQKMLHISLHANTKPTKHSEKAISASLLIMEGEGVTMRMGTK